MGRHWVLRRSYASEQGEIRWDVLGDGPPVVLLHGTPFSSYVWREVAAGLARHHAVYVWDLAGYGQSEQREGQDVSIAAQTRILAALLDHWQLDRPHVVAHDIGGAVALRTLLLEARRYASLVLVDPVAVAPWGTGFFQLASVHADTLTQLPGPVHDGLLRGYVGWAANRPLPADELDRLIEPWTGPRGAAAFYRQIVQNDQRMTDAVQPRYGEIDVPTLIVWGEEDAWLPLERGIELHGLIPGSRLRTIPGANHLVQHDAPTELTVELVRFLAERSGGG